MFYQTAHTPLQLALVVMVEAEMRKVVMEPQLFSVLFLQLAVAVVEHIFLVAQTGERVGQVVVAVDLLEQQAQPHREKATQVALDFKALTQRQAVAVAVKAQ